MNKAESQEFLPLLLLRVSLRAKQRIMRLAEEHDLTIMQAYTLILLEPDTPVPMSSISELLNCDASNVTGIVDRLSSAGYMARQDHATDRRIKCVVITEKGARLRSELLHQLTIAKIPGLNELSSQEADTLRELLQRILGFK